jgi:type I restriction enzyme S subunit
MFNGQYPTKLWREVVTIKNGKDYKKIPNKLGTYPIYGSGGYMGIRCDNYICNENSIIIGRKGNVTNPLFVKEKYWNVDTAFGIEVGNELNPFYFYQHTLCIDLASMVTGAAIPSLTKSDLLGLTIKVPPISLQNQFAEFVKLIDKSKFIVQQQIKDLQELLDSKMDEYFR